MADLSPLNEVLQHEVPRFQDGQISVYSFTNNEIDADLQTTLNALDLFMILSANRTPEQKMGYQNLFKQGS